MFRENLMRPSSVMNMGQADPFKTVAVHQRTWLYVSVESNVNLCRCDNPDVRVIPHSARGVEFDAVKAVKAYELRDTMRRRMVNGRL
jgi:hypothetical protein